MDEDELSFKEKYKLDQSRETQIKTFKKLIKRSVNDDITEIWLKAMATINLEMEHRFAGDGITFKPPIQDLQGHANTFSLIQRQKSKRSTKKKRKENIKKFKEALENEDEGNVPENVRHIFDLYGFKLICPNLKNSQSVICTVVKDILADIQERFPEKYDEAQAFKDNLNYMSVGMAVDFITSNFPSQYPNLQERIDRINVEQREANEVQNFLHSFSDDVSNLTYGDFYSLIIQCHKVLSTLSYGKPKKADGTTRDQYCEFDFLQDNIEKLEETLAKYRESGEAGQLIKKADFKRYSEVLKRHLDMVEKKRTNKIDLSVGDLMFFDVLTTSKALKKAGITWSDDVTRNKFKTNPNGYIANFYSLDGPNGIHAEMQVQSLYRYFYGEIGPAAHNKMPGKKRILYSPEKHHRKRWFRKLTDSIAHRSICLGNGEIKVNNLQEDFYEQYKPRTGSQLEVYRRFMRKQFKNIYKFVNAYRGNISRYEFNEDFSEVIKVGEQELTPDFIENAAPFEARIDDVMEL